MCRHNTLCNCSASLRGFGDAHSGCDCVQIKAGGPAGDEHEICCLCDLGSFQARMRCCVDDGEVETSGIGLGQQFPSMSCACPHSMQLSVRWPTLVPGKCGLLRVEVEKRRT